MRVRLAQNPAWLHLLRGLAADLARFSSSQILARCKEGSQTQSGREKRHRRYRNTVDQVPFHLKFLLDAVQSLAAFRAVLRDQKRDHLRCGDLYQVNEVTLISLVSDQSRNVLHDAVSKPEKSFCAREEYRNNVSILFVSVLSRKCGLVSVNAKHRKSIRETENSGVSHFNRDCCIYNTCMLALYLQSVSSNVQLKESQRGFPPTNVIWLMKVEQVYRSNRHLY
ncbi:hypothetical protein HN011_005660 [Eciton burchellii]|nr:hypothetical protein HN011_005660 [Eciton burchellii]